MMLNHTSKTIFYSCSLKLSEQYQNKGRMFLFAFRPFYIPFIVIYCMAFYYSFTGRTTNP